MDEIVKERSEGVLRVELNRPEKKNALTSSMYTKLADVFNAAAKDDSEGSADGLSGKASA